MFLFLTVSLLVSSFSHALPLPQNHGTTSQHIKKIKHGYLLVERPQLELLPKELTQERQNKRKAYTARFVNRQVLCETQQKLTIDENRIPRRLSYVQLVKAYPGYQCQKRTEKVYYLEKSSTKFLQRPIYHLKNDNTDSQKRCFAKWINLVFKKAGKDVQVKDLLKDVQQGSMLLTLVETLTGKQVRREKGSTKLHKIHNVNKALEILQKYNAKLFSNIRSEEIVDGNSKTILALLWYICQHFQIKKAMSSDSQNSELERSLLAWCRQCTQKYSEVDIVNFTTSWKDGLAFNALLNYHRPDSFDFKKLVGKPADDNLRHAFQRAQKEIGIAPLLDIQDVNTDFPDKKCILMYVASFYEVLMRPKDLNESEELETTTAARSDSPTPSSVSTMSEWDDFNETLQQVLTWLQQAETQLRQQEYVSENVDKVKEQFREHEDFMMILTSHQTSVGSVLEFGSQLINENIVVGKEEKEIREQMTLLSERWENLRVNAMQRQSDLHQHLMKLQQLQLTELANWLTKAEGKIMTAAPIGCDIDVVKTQVDEHKAMQDDLENQQQHVNSLSHMVVVVDEAESENATADLEEQLGMLGERWSAVCKWTEQRWNNLQEVLTSWQQYRDEEQRLNEWLAEKEKTLQHISDIDMGDKTEVQLQIQNLKNLEVELTQQQSSFGNFNLAAQTVAQTLDEDSPTILRIQETMEDFNNRWNKIASMLNTKMKHLRGMENKLQSFLKELDENLEWINDTEMLLRPNMNPKKELVESMEQAIKKRRLSIVGLTETGEELLQHTLSAGQSAVGLQQSLTTFQERWTVLLTMISDRKQAVEVGEQRKLFVVQVQKILVVITEVTVYMENIIVECKSKPTELVIKIEVKMKELRGCTDALTKLSEECEQMSDPALRSALEIELNSAQEQLKSAETLLKNKHEETKQIIETEPPQEYMEATTSVKTALDDVFPSVSNEFKYAAIESMKQLAEDLKEKLAKLQKQEAVLKSLTIKLKELFKNLLPEKNQKFQKQFSDLNRQWTDCKKITEARLQRVNEAILQTKELEVAMSETFNWMDDVDKFLEEITSTIAEGDAETITSQVKEVVELQQDIETVQKKVNSLIETCTLIMNRGEAEYSGLLKTKLSRLNQRWQAIITNTERQKESLKDAGLKFQEVEGGVKAIMQYLKGVQAGVEAEKVSKLDNVMLKSKIQHYQSIGEQLQAKKVIVEEYIDSVKELVSKSAPGSDTPAALLELQSAKASFAKITAKIDTLLEQMRSAESQFTSLEAQVNKLNKCMDTLDQAISKSSEKLDGDDEELEKCLKILDEQSSNLAPEKVREIEETAKKMISENVCVTSVNLLISDYKNRLDDCKERCKKVHYILEGEVMKRRQLRDDITELEGWLNNTEQQVQLCKTGQQVMQDDFTETLKEQISLNEALVTSAERSIKDLVSTEVANRDLETRLTQIKTRWQTLLDNIKELELQPKIKEMEKNFVQLEGSTFSDIDNLKRKVKKIKLNSPEVNDIQMAVESLEDLNYLCKQIEESLTALQNIAVELSARMNRNLDPQVQQVGKEFEVVKNIINTHEVMFADALPLAEVVYANMDNITDWLEEVNKQLTQMTASDLPENPEENIQITQKMLRELNERLSEVQQLNNNTVQLCQMSEAEPFRVLEARVHTTYTTYTRTLADAQQHLDALISWRDQLDEYKHKVGELNAWIDGRLGTLESIGGVSNKFDVEMELQKCMGVKSIVAAKESELDSLKSIGDEIATKGQARLIQVDESAIFKRWDELERKTDYTQSSLQRKLKEIEKAEEEPPRKKINVVEENEVLINEPINIVEVESAPPMIMDLPDDEEGTTTTTTVVEEMVDEMISCNTVANVECAPVEPTISVDGPQVVVPLKQPSSEKTVRLDMTIETLIAELDEIEAMMFNLDKDENTEIEHVHGSVQILDDKLDELTPDFERLVDAATNNEQQDAVPELSEDTRASLTKLSRKMSGVHAGLEIRRQSLRDADYKMTRLRTDLHVVQEWIVTVETLLRDPHSDKILALEHFEQHAAELEAVNIRSEQLSSVFPQAVLPKVEVQLLNKKFKMVSRHFEQYQRPEEKVTTYRVSVETGDPPEADTRANVSIKLFGEYGNSGQLQCQKSETKRKKFQSNQVDLFTFKSQPWLGKLSKLRVWHDNEGTKPAWYLSSIYILDEISGRLFCFVLDTWLSKEAGAVLKEAPVNAMALSKETGADTLVRKHKVVDVHWLFDTFRTTTPDNTKIPWQQFVTAVETTSGRIDVERQKLQKECFEGRPFDDYQVQEQVIEDVEKCIAELQAVVAGYMQSCATYVEECSETEMQRVDVAVTGLRYRWNGINRELKQRQQLFEGSRKLWKQLQEDMSVLSRLVESVEKDIAGRPPTAENVKFFEATVEEHSEMFNSLNEVADHVIEQSGEAEGRELSDRLTDLNIRWEQIKLKINNIKRSLYSGDDSMKSFMERLENLKRHLNDAKQLLFNVKPHPLDEEALESYITKIKGLQQQHDAQSGAMLELEGETAKVLSRADLSLTQRSEVDRETKQLHEDWTLVTSAVDTRLESAVEQLSRSTQFLEQLEELYEWMCNTRNLLEGREQGRPNCNVDPETMKSSLETRKTNVQTINKLLKEFKDEGELANGPFPADVGEKIARLNADWQVVIRLAITLKEEVSEEVVIEEVVQESESTVFHEFPVNNDNGEVASIHDKLRSIEQKLHEVAAGISIEDIQSSILHQENVEHEMMARKSTFDDVINNASQGDVSKLQDHWSLTWNKVTSQKAVLDKLNGESRRYNEINVKLKGWHDKAEVYFAEQTKVGNTVAELEAQLAKHKTFEDETHAWVGSYNSIRQIANSILQNYPTFELDAFKTSHAKLVERWTSIDQRNAARHSALQEALDRLLLFHKEMINALTWLSSAESKVAELDSLVEGNHTEDNTDLEELQREMMVLEDDISAHQAIFQSLNATGNQIMRDLESGEVRTALQSKLDDMNDRWNSLGLRVIDIRDRMADGTGVWRQLLLDMQEIIDWLVRAGQELTSQQPLANNTANILQQHGNHQAFKSKLKDRQVIIRQALDQGHDFLTNNKDKASPHGDNLMGNVTTNLQSQVEHIESQWKSLMNDSDNWQRSLDTVINLVNKLNREIDTLNQRLSDAEALMGRFTPLHEVKVEQVPALITEVKNFNETLQALQPQFDTLQNNVKSLNNEHNVALATDKQKLVDDMIRRWKVVNENCEKRHNHLQNSVNNNQTPDDSTNQLKGSVSPPWERGCSLNKVPYFINHDTKLTQWDHPKMTELYHTLSELNDVKYAAYRTSMKLRCIQKACCLDLVELNSVIVRCLETQPLPSNNDELIDVADILQLLLQIFGMVEQTRKDTIVVSQCVDLTLNWLLNVYDSGRIGKIRVLSFKIGLVLLSRAKLEEKWKYLFKQICDHQGRADSKKLGLLLHDCIQIPRQLGEVAAFGGSNIEPSARSCFEKAKNNSYIESNDFVEWTLAEPQSLVWMPVLHRLASAETAKHDAKCSICKEYPIVGFRYRCLKCFNYDLCQGCFWSGKVTKGHRLTHPVHQYTLSTSTGEDLSDFVKLMKNKFKSRKYRSRPPKKLGYLPVQTIMEGSTIETPSIPSSPNMNFSYTSALSADGSASPGSARYRLEDDINEEHRLIQHMCQTLTTGDDLKNNIQLKSPSAILATLETGDDTQDIDQLIKGLEEEHRALESEYNRLKGINTDGANPETSPRDTELLAEAKLLRQHKGRLESRMQILEDHNKQLEGQLHRLRLLLEQPQSERQPPSSVITPSLTPSSSYHGSPEMRRKEVSLTNGHHTQNSLDIQQVTSEIEHAFPVD